MSFWMFDILGFFLISKALIQSIFKVCRFLPVNAADNFKLENLFIRSYQRKKNHLGAIALHSM